MIWLSIGQCGPEWEHISLTLLLLVQARSCPGLATTSLFDRAGSALSLGADTVGLLGSAVNLVGMPNLGTAAIFAGAFGCAASNLFLGPAIGDLGRIGKDQSLVGKQAIWWLSGSTPWD